MDCITMFPGVLTKVEKKLQNPCMGNKSTVLSETNLQVKWLC